MPQQRSEAERILNFDYDTDAFIYAGETVITTTVKKKLTDSIGDLTSLRTRLIQKPFEIPESISIPLVYRKTKSALSFNLSLTSVLDRRELRALSFALNYTENQKTTLFSNPKDLKIILETFDVNWRNYFTIGLFDCYLQNWVLKSDSLKLLSLFILPKISNYSGKNVVINSIKKNIRYFDLQNGDVTLGAELALKKYHLNQLTQYLGLPDHYLNYYYFSNVILAFFYKSISRIEEILEDIDSVLTNHNRTITNKRIVSKIIISTNSEANLYLQDKVKSMAYKFIGDPNISSFWYADENLSDSEKIDLKHAVDILNEWITKQFITVFFEKCINDERRKRFWLRYSKHIKRLKVFGSDSTRQILLNDHRISEYVLPRFYTARRPGNVSALMFRIGEHKLIEFSNQGYAFYAYKNSDADKPAFEPRNLNSVDWLRNSYLPMLAYISGTHLYSLSDNGRLIHRDGNLSWETVFDYWLSKKVGVHV